MSGAPTGMLTSFFTARPSRDRLWLAKMPIADAAARSMRASEIVFAPAWETSTSARPPDALTMPP